MPIRDPNEILFSPSLLNFDYKYILDNNLITRPLARTDFDRGFLQLLEQLTVVGDVTEENFQDQFDRMKNVGHYYVIVVEDKTSGQIIAATTMFTELKFIHACAIRGRIEDVVVDTNYRGKQLGKHIVDVAVKLARNIGCYKISLDCRDEMINFYTKLDFKKEKGRGNTLVIRIQDDQNHA